jgi:hypothetical protein
MSFTFRSKTYEHSSIPSLARRSFRGSCWLAPVLVLGLLLGGPAGQVSAGTFEFDMVPSGCLPSATGHVTVETKGKGQVEKMVVQVSGLPKKTGFDLFVIQKPGAPFGMGWYQSDLQTDANGEGHVTVRGRFNGETFIVGNGAAGVPAPTPHGDLDAGVNPTTKPVHMYHLGLWFDSPTDGAAAGCPGGPTNFNGDHSAGVQVLNTSNFPDLAGPLSQVQ